MVDHPRARKMADRIKVIVAQMLESRIKDPRLGFITITDVRVTGDLQSASIFYTVLGDEEDRTETAAALASAKGIIRSEVGKQTGTRLTPTVEFFLDSVPDTAKDLDVALLEAQRRDAELAKLRESAKYAGESDPYRKSSAEDIEEAADEDEAPEGGPGPDSAAHADGLEPQTP